MGLALQVVRGERETSPSRRADRRRGHPGLHGERRLQEAGRRAACLVHPTVSPHLSQLRFLWFDYM